MSAGIISWKSCPLVTVTNTLRHSNGNDFVGDGGTQSKQIIWVKTAFKLLLMKAPGDDTSDPSGQ